MNGAGHPASHHQGTEVSSPCDYMLIENGSWLKPPGRVRTCQIPALRVPVVFVLREGATELLSGMEAGQMIYRYALSTRT